MDKDHLSKRLDFLWKNGYIDKKSVPFIKTAINRPLWAAWNFFFRPAIASADFKSAKLGFSFLKFRYKEDIMAFLNEYFPGLIMFPYFNAAWSVQDEKGADNAAPSMAMEDQSQFARRAGILRALQLREQRRR